MFNKKKAIKEAVRAMKNKTAVAVYLGFNPVTHQGDVFIEAKSAAEELEHIFVPLDGNFFLPRSECDYAEMKKLFHIQEELSLFLLELGHVLQADVYDRCLYAPFLSCPTPYSFWTKEEQEEYRLLQKAFCQKYKEQLEKMQHFDDWIEYHNAGFLYRYVPFIEVKQAIDGIYRKKEELAKNGQWEMAETAVIKLHDILRELKG